MTLPVAAYGALGRHELRRVAGSLAPRALFVVIPVFLSWFFAPAFRYALTYNGDPPGAALLQALAGQVVMFTTASLVFFGQSVYEDRDSHSDARLSTAGVSYRSQLASRCGVNALVLLVQAQLVLAGGSVVLGAERTGHHAAAVVLTAAWVLVEVALGAFLVAVARGGGAFTMVVYAGAVLMTAASGGLAPYALLPEWGRQAARVLPSNWYLRGIDELLLRDATLGDVLPNVALLLGFAVVLSAAGFALTGRRRDVSG